MLTSASASYSSAVGVETRAMHEGSFAEGSKTIAEATYSHAAGIGTHTKTKGGFVVGTYNEPSENHLFAVGNGTSAEAKANAFAVSKDGNTNVCGHRIRNVADAVEDTDAVNLRLLNAGLPIFWATYGVTTGSEIYEAYQAGKLVMCKHNGNYYGMQYFSPNEWEGEVTGAEAVFYEVANPSPSAMLVLNDVGGAGWYVVNSVDDISGYVTGDHVVAHGESGIWTWRKWSSGIAECWGTVTVEYNVPYRLVSYLSLPFTFTETSIATGVIADENSYSATLRITPSSSQIWVQLDTTNYEFSEDSTVKISVHVLGRWK